MKFPQFVIGRYHICFAILLFIITFLVYYFTTERHPTPYNSFVRLADAFLHGRLYLTEKITWLELAPKDGRYYIVPPPMPAILLMPFVSVFGLATNQTLASIILGSLNIVLIFLVTRGIIKNRIVQLWTTAMFGFGTIHWWIATAGGVWTFSQVTSVSFLFLAIYAVFKGKHSLLVGLLLGASFWSRLPTIFSLPFFIIMLSDRWLKKPSDTNILNRVDPKPLFYLGVGVGIFVCLNFIYNFLRFGTPLDVSYYLIPGILEEPWYKNGIFDISYIPRHLRVIFKGIPIFLSTFPYVKPSWDGMAIWITTPAFAYALFADIRDKLAIGCWLSIIPIALLDFTHGTWGFAQFGYRFGMDFYPFLFLLTVMGMGDRVRWHHMILICFGILVNLWGVLWINKFGWVGY